MAQRWGLEGCDEWLWCALLGVALAGCGGSARSGTLSTRGVSDSAPGGEACESELEFVPLDSVPERHDGLWTALAPSSRQLFWGFRGSSGSGAVGLHWSAERGLTSLVDSAEVQPGTMDTPSDFELGLISGDGNVAVGWSEDAATRGGLRWSAGTEVRPLDFEPGAVNRDGSVIAGVRDAQLVRWSQAGDLEELGPLPSPRWLQVSAAGDVITGGDGERLCFRWSEAGGFQELGALPGADSCASVMVASDAADVLAGAVYKPGRAELRVFRWTAAGGMEDLQIGDSPGTSAMPLAISADGSVVLASELALDGSFSHLVRWTANTGAVDIGAGANLIFNSMSAEGDSVVGTLMDETRGRWSGFRWTEATGLQELGIAVLRTGVGLGGKLVVGQGPDGPQLLRFGDLGAGARLVDRVPPGIVPEGWSDPELHGVSEDGGMLFGDALNPDGERQTWLQHLSCPDP
jgi:hypothetical protein